MRLGVKALAEFSVTDASQLTNQPFRVVDLNGVV